MPPQYQSASYWNDRFKHEKHFEWLGDGSDSVLPHLETCLRSTTKLTQGPRLLHVGAGSSTLSELILEKYQHVFGDDIDASLIVNMDFSEVSVQRGQEIERERRMDHARMRWVRADALKWNDLLALAEDDAAGLPATVEGAFDIVIDKSTSDAISCADDIPLQDTDTEFHPLLRSYVNDSVLSTKEDMFLHPVGLLALHLASLVRPGGVWIALSYSSTRFGFLEHPVQDDMGSIHPRVFWKLEKVEDLEAPSGQGKTGIHAPNVLHRIYIMRRTNASTSVSSS